MSYDNDQFGYYYADIVVNRPGTYNVIAAALQTGGLRLMVYKNTDFTDFVAEQNIVALPDEVDINGGMQITFDENLIRDSDFFKTKTQQFSAIVQGCIRTENTTFNNYTFFTNMKIKVYINEQLLISKDNLLT